MRIIAEAVGDRRVIEIVGHAGNVVRVTVKVHHLQPMPLSLFE